MKQLQNIASTDIRALLRFLGLMLMAEGGLMGLCVVPAIHFADGTLWRIAACAAATLTVGGGLYYAFRNDMEIKDRRMSYLLVTVLWLTLSAFATLPFLATGSTHSLTAAWFEAMSGVTSCGATVFANVGSLPA